MYTHLLICLFFLSLPITIITFKNPFTSNQNPTDLNKIKTDTAPSTVNHAKNDVKIEQTCSCDSTKKSLTRPVVIKNNISQEMISYTKCFQTFVPDFELTIDGTVINPNQKQTVQIKNNRLTASYSYNFLNGFKKGKKTVTFELPTDKEEVEIAFSWSDDWRIRIKDGTPIAKKIVY